MSFIIAVYTNEGIILASDSRITYTTTETLENGIIQKNYGIHTSDTTYKTFLCNSRIGISTCGTSSISNKPIAGYIEEFISKKIDEHSSVEMVSQGLIDYFNMFSPVPDTYFIVAGYDEGETTPQINKISVEKKSIDCKDTSTSGAIWDGEIEVLARLLNSVAVKKSDGVYVDLKNYAVGFNYFTLQDAIDFAQYAVDSTIKTMAFQQRAKTVGGPIDILAIKPTGAFWIQKKELHA